MKKIISIQLAVLLGLLLNKLQAQIPIPAIVDSLAMVQFYNSTGGPNWINHTNWRVQGAPLNTWYGLTVENGRIIEIDLSNNNLTGSVPAGIALLAFLRTLDLSSNTLTGQLPPVLLSQELETLDLSFNQFTGAIPDFLFTLKEDLSYLGLNDNNLSGDLPDAINNLQNLRFLYLQHNLFTGPLPLVNSPGLLSIKVNGNQFSGSIPAQYLSYPSMTILYLDSNQLSGSIPHDLFQMRNIVEMDLSANQLTGDFPPISAGGLTLLKILYLNNNQLTGNLPPGSFSDLLSLEVLGLNHNQFSGPLAVQLGEIPNMRHFNVRDNMFDEPLPDFLVNGWPNLTFLGLINNNFTFEGMEAIVQRNIDTLEYKKQRALPLKLNPNTNALKVSAGGTLSNNTYRWYFNGNPVATKTGDSTYKAKQSGNYYVEISNNLCPELILKSKTLFVNVIEPVAKTDVYVFPNPATSLINVNFELVGKGIITLTDRQGRILLSKTVVGTGKNSVQLDVSRFVPSTYFVTITNSKGAVVTVQLNKQ